MTYDLTREAWIPVRWIPSDEGPPALGLRDILTEAHRIREITASPLQTAALYRLLQALFIRLYVHPEGETDDSGWDEDAWFEVWEQERFDSERIHAYFDRWQDKKQRFDLLHPERPFYGHPDPFWPNEGGTNWLVPVWAKGNNETLFDHTTDETCPALSLPEVARALVETQAYALGGTSRPKTLALRFEDAPLSRGLLFWIRGNTLFESLLLNTPPARFTRMPSESNDLPVWEREDLPDHEPSAESGYLDYLTWPSRHIRLLASKENGVPVVRKVHIAQGKKWVSKAHDPLWARRTTKDGARYPLKLRKEQALWREAPSWLGLKLENKKDLPPATFQWLAFATTTGEGLEGYNAWEVDVFGLVNDKAKMELIRHDRFMMHTEILLSHTFQARVEDAVERANRQAKILRSALRLCAIELVASLDAEVDGQKLSVWLEQDSRFENSKNNTIKRLRDIQESFQAERRFWAFLETGFTTNHERENGFADWLDHLAALATAGPEGSDARTIAADRHLSTWARTLHRAALRAYDEATEAFVSSPRSMEAVALGRARLRAAAPYADAFKKPA